MGKYSGVIIYRTEDEHGPIEVVETPFERSLHFGTAPKQSTMDRADPIRLNLTYTRAIAASLLFTEAPSRALLIGLGGGSLAKFLLHHFPALEIDAVELRPAVHTVAERFFGLPQDPRLTVHHQDAAEFVRRLDPARSSYDLIWVDAFVADGIAGSVCRTGFYDQLRTVSSDWATLAVNLWSGDQVDLEELLDHIRAAFNIAYRLPVEGRENIIALAPTSPLTRRRLGHLAERAKLLEEQTGVEMGVFLRHLRKANRWP